MQAVRTDGDSFIEIDVQRNHYPFLRLERGEVEGQVRWLLIVDSNKGGQVVGQHQGVALLVLKAKRLRALRDFLNHVDLGD